MACLSVKESFDALFCEADDLNLISSVLPFTRHSFAILRFLLPLNISIIRSIISHALISPSLISLLSSSFLRSVLYFLVLSSYWKLIWCSIIFLIPRVSGFPSTIASIFTPNVSSSLVFLYKRLIRLSTSAFFFNSRTILIPSFDDSLEMSTTSLAFLASIRSTTSEINLPILAPTIV